MSDEGKTGAGEEMDEGTAAAIVTAVILHRASVEDGVDLLEGGERDEGFWGRAGRAGTASVLTHKGRRG